MTNPPAASPAVSFSFGENWLKFLNVLDGSRIEKAEESFRAFTRLRDLSGHTFLDIGSGSGLSSLVAHRLGAKVYSFDYDPQSVECTREVRRRFADGDGWQVTHGSVLDKEYLGTLGRFSYVYSWGVLHHTGGMWEAVENASRLVEPGGYFHLALYSKQRVSPLWHRIKRLCNRHPRTIMPALMSLYLGFTFLNIAARGRNPFRAWKEYSDNRGMSMWRDVEDWFGGLPYEYCTPDEAVDYLSDRRFVLLRLKTTTSMGCNEFLFRKA